MDPSLLNDHYLTALCIWREMRGASIDERRACYWVIHNRSTDARERWPRSLAGVVTQKYQFSSFNATDANASKWPVATPGGPDWIAWCEIIAIMDEPDPDPTGGANAYENLPAGATMPGWADRARLVKVIGSTRYYKL
jgi:hypothetical protein